MVLNSQKDKAPKRNWVSLEPSYWILLENPFHKSSRSTRASCQAGRLVLGNDDAKVSKSPIWVNKKIAESVPLYALGQNCRNEKYIQTSIAN
jgi:hypothetical protein